MLLLIGYVLLALGCSFLCSLLEATLLTVTPSAIETAKQRGKKWAVAMERLKSDIDRSLSAILTLNTVAHTMGAAGAGAQYVKLYGDATGGVFAGFLTLAILVFTEIIPKTLGARYASFFAAPTAWLLPWMERLLGPLVWLCRQVTRLVTFGKANQGPVHREELIAVANLGERLGEIGKHESAVVRNILQLSETTVAKIMTPRTVMFTLPHDLSFAEFVDRVADEPYSRIPVYGESPDEIRGFVLKSDALLRCLRAPDGKISEVMLPLAATPEQIGVDRLFSRMLREGRHLLVVHNEFGTIVGLVTLEDVLETVIGSEILDETDRDADLRKVARNLWQDRASMMVPSGEA
ncbi:CBS domain containing-hemolysin-like protein [Haloferula luteola]|uniref:CBS domain containing-hemolysin-like protein n=1 Tax=Haloferula luteola TaxID=595692 RepID=A0A840UX55_9BACT|nr:hemolysin family protein [Haloferula luteola]MBB5350315.1 CBS domain containing-hemolysin-like protein [Haloferula luteola]